MAKDEPTTPEKQLLKLIENPSRDTVKNETAKREGRKWFSLGALKGRFAFLESLSIQKLGSVKQLFKSSPGLHQLNFGLKIGILFLTIYFGYSVVAMVIQLKKASNLILQPDHPPLPAAEEAATLKNMNYYLDKVAGRDLFKFGAKPKPTISERPTFFSEEPKPKKFSLVGIAWSVNPEAMIEDTEQKRTYFVRQGQALDNSVKVVAIFKDRVVLSDNGKEFELT